jgi:hypothetical protein
MTVANIRSHITKFNRHYAIKGYSKLKKDDLVEKVLTAQSRLSKTGMKKAKLKIVDKKPPTPKAPTPKAPTPLQNQHQLQKQEH